MEAVSSVVAAMTHKNKIKAFCLDFETYSPKQLKVHGIRNYCADPGFTIFCMALGIVFEDGLTQSETFKGDKITAIAQTIARLKIPLIAHNVRFERECMNILLRRKEDTSGLLRVNDISRWDDTMSQCAFYNLPLSLGAASKMMNFGQKEEQGESLVKKIARLKTAEEAIAMYEKNATEIDGYCQQDVRLTMQLWSALPKLNEVERKRWELEIRMNERGFKCRKNLIAMACEARNAEMARLHNEMCEVTDGKVQKPGSRKTFLAWLNEEIEGNVKSSAKGVIEDLIVKGGLSDKAKRACEVLRNYNRTPTSKWESAKNLEHKNRINDYTLYGAAMTARSVGRGIQVQNFPKPAHDFDVTRFIRQVKNYDCSMPDLQSALRFMVSPEEGEQIVTSDFVGIELRVLLWLVDDEEHLEMIREGRDLYVNMASQIYRKPESEVTKADRFVGKQCVLGLGYQMGAPKFCATLENYGQSFSERDVRTLVRTYRRLYAKVQNAWKKLHAAFERTTRSGLTTHSSKVTYKQGEISGLPVVICELPSHRPIIYMNAREYHDRAVYDKTFGKSVVTNERVHGGVLVENIVQAIARDIMCSALTNADEIEGITPLFQVHDEIVCSVAASVSTEEFENGVMKRMPQWARGIPLDCESVRSPFWSKQ